MGTPKITPMACPSCIKPAFTKPTTITVVMELLCTKVVTRMPTKTALKRLVVRV